MSVELRHGDALVLLRELADESVDLVLTDPPYSSGGMFRGDRAGQTTAEKYVQTGTIARRADFDGDSRDQRGFLAWASLWLADCWRVTKRGGSLLVFTDWRQLPTMTDAVQAGGWVWRGLIVWDKTTIARPRPGFSSRAEYLVWGTRGEFTRDVYLQGLISAAAPRGDDRRHMTEKPLGLLERLVEIAPDGGLVLDPFVGSGSTLDAARNRGRSALGFEINDEHVETAGQRLAQMAISSIPVKNRATLLTDEAETAGNDRARGGSDSDPVASMREKYADNSRPPSLPPCLPHGVADCSVCLAEAEKIVNERLAESYTDPGTFRTWDLTRRSWRWPA